MALKFGYTLELLGGDSDLSGLRRSLGIGILNFPHVILMSCQVWEPLYYLLDGWQMDRYIDACVDDRMDGKHGWMNKWMNQGTGHRSSWLNIVVMIWHWLKSPDSFSVITPQLLVPWSSHTEFPSILLICELTLLLLWALIFPVLLD